MKEVTSRQVAFIYILSVAASSSYALPMAMSNYAGKASVVASLISILAGIAYASMLSYMLKKSGSLYDFFRDCFGKTIANVIGVILSVWLLVCASLALRLFYERISTTVFSFLPKSVCIGVLAVLCAFALIYGSKIFGRIGETIFVIFVLLLILLIVFNINGMDFTEYFPINSGTDSSIIKTFVFPVSTFSYLTYYLYFHNSKQNEMSAGRIHYSTISGVLVQTFILFICVGTFGIKLLSKISYPLFTTIKNITVAGDIDHLEGIFTSAWIMVDFVFATALLISASSGIKKAFLRSENKNKEAIIDLAVCGCAFLGAVLINLNRFQIDRYNVTFVPYLNMFFGILLPIFTLLFYQIKKKVI